MTIDYVLANGFTLLDANGLVTNVPFTAVFFGSWPLPTRVGDTGDVCRADPDLLADEVLLLGVLTPPGFEIEARIFADAVPAVAQHGVVPVVGHCFDVPSALYADT